MRRWDGLVDGYVAECEARGLAAETIADRRRELERWGAWLKRRRPKVNLEQLDSALVLRYLRERSNFRSKATQASSGGNPVESYQYDPTGRRIKTVNAGGTTWHNLLALTVHTGQTSKTFSARGETSGGRSSAMRVSLCWFC